MSDDFSGKEANKGRRICVLDLAGLRTEAQKNERFKNREGG